MPRRADHGVGASPTARSPPVSRARSPGRSEAPRPRVEAPPVFSLARSGPASARSGEFRSSDGLDLATAGHIAGTRDYTIRRRLGGPSGGEPEPHPASPGDLGQCIGLISISSGIGTARSAGYPLRPCRRADARRRFALTSSLSGRLSTVRDDQCPRREKRRASSITWLRRLRSIFCQSR